MSDSSSPSPADSALRHLLAARRLGVLATIRRDGRPQLSMVTYFYDRAAEVIRVSITADRAKTRNLWRDPRAVLQASSDDGWSYVVADGAATLSEVARHPTMPPSTNWSRSTDRSPGNIRTGTNTAPRWSPIGGWCSGCPSTPSTA